MKLPGYLIPVLALSPVMRAAADANSTVPQTSRQILPTNFKPPQVFKNINLLRNINLEKGYPRHTINVVIENTDANPQQDYFLPFEGHVIGRVGSLEARDKKDISQSLLDVNLVEYDPHSTTQFYIVRLPEPLQPAVQQTLSISYSILSALEPRPATIDQGDKQYLQYVFNAYQTSAYPTAKQKTKIKFPNSDIPDFYSGQSSDGKEDPQRQGSILNYGPYDDVAAGISEPVFVRYEHTHSVNHATLLERDLEISHWGGNIATEERYWLVNRGASLKSQFSRSAWQQAAFYNPATSALKELKIPLIAGSANPYFVDDIGNVSTSRFRTNTKEALLELKPRYPVFGSWKYSFKIGWDQNLKGVLRKLKEGDGYVLKVPFLEGPKQSEGIEYEKVVVRVILPEGATNIKYETDVEIASADTSLHQTFMDTLGRTTLKLTAFNVVDDLRGRSLIVSYDYPFSAGFRKPVTILVSIFGIFVGAWAISRLDISIGKGQ